MTTTADATSAATVAGNEPLPVLWQLTLSHYHEKVRWRHDPAPRG